MAQFSQNDRPLRIQTPLGEDALLVDKFDGEEAVSSLFEFRARLRSHNAAIKPAHIIGQGVAVSVARADGSNASRYFHGVVTRFENHGQIDREFCLYSAILRPWAWLLTHRADCRIFQRQSALDIVKDVLQRSGFGPFESKVGAVPPVREYCVQYNESDFDFVSRLLEDEGIFYYFRHERNRHVMVLGDDANALYECAESRVSLKGKLTEERGADRLQAWAHGYELRPGKWAHGDYNFETPEADLLGRGAAGQLPKMSDMEVYEYPGGHGTGELGRRRAAVRAEQSIVEHDVVRGESFVEPFAAGARFAVEEHHAAADAGRKFVLTRVRHAAQQAGTYDGGFNDPAPRYVNAFEAIPADAKLRPVRRTAKPHIVGPQTARVVGPKGEEIWTDRYGRIKVKFFWDRKPEKDDTASCWVRVAFPSAGPSFGIVAVPRVNSEVVVEYLNGDPDRPLVTGCVYNAANMPPLTAAGRKSGAPSDLPGGKMMLTVRSQSLGKTGGYNELAMNDDKGSETLFIKAQKDEYHKVGNDREHEVANNAKLTIGKDETIKVGNNRADDITKDLQTTIGGNQTLKVASNRKLSVGGDHTETIVGKTSETAREIEITGQTKITLQCGGSKIELNPGMVTISGPIVKIN